MKHYTEQERHEVKMKYTTTLMNINLNGGKTPNSARMNDDNENENYLI